jgi:hypothetical protein
VTGWRHNDDERQWELGYYDLARERFIVGAWVTDEHISRTVPEMTAARLYRTLGSVPPPLAGYPAPPPVPLVPAVYAGGRGAGQ